MWVYVAFASVVLANQGKLIRSCYCCCLWLNVSDSVWSDTFCLRITYMSSCWVLGDLSRSHMSTYEYELTFFQWFCLAVSTQSMCDTIMSQWQCIVSRCVSFVQKGSKLDSMLPLFRWQYSATHNAHSWVHLCAEHISNKISQIALHGHRLYAVCMCIWVCSLDTQTMPKINCDLFHCIKISSKKSIWWQVRRTLGPWNCRMRSNTILVFKKRKLTNYCSSQ